MLTAWNGFGCTEDNVITTEALIPYRVRVILSMTPRVVTVIALPAQVRAVRLYSTDASIQYAVDMPPDPALNTTDLLLDWNAFRAGDTLIPNQWQSYVLPDDTLPHDLHLMSEVEGPSVLVVALTEG